MKPETGFTLLIAIVFTLLLLAIGWLIVNMLCHGVCGGSTYPGVPWGPP
jgi:hypothetical protein